MPHLLISGAALVVIMAGFFASVHSPLGLAISAGESPGFEWIRSNITSLMGFLLAYLILVCWFQIKQTLPAFLPTKLLPLLICIEVVSIATVALLLFFQWTSLILAALNILLISLLLQALFYVWYPDSGKVDRHSIVSRDYSANPGLFLVLLFAVGVAVSFIDPSWRRLSEHILLDSDWDNTLRYLYPPVLSGVTNVWFGIGMMIIINGFRWLYSRYSRCQQNFRLINFLAFFSLAAIFTAILLVTLYQAIPWQINGLNLNMTVWQLFIFFSMTGGMLLSAVFYKIASFMPGGQGKSAVGIIALCMGTPFIYPVAWFLFSRWNRRSVWWLLLLATIGLSFILIYLVLFGDLFNPWFTAFSYLKGAILMAASVVAAGVGVLIIEDLFAIAGRPPASRRRSIVILAAAGVVGLWAFYSLSKFPEVKTAILQYNELTRVSATFAREFTGALGLGRWFHLGQRPPQNNSPHPWPPALAAGKDPPVAVAAGL